MRKLIKCALSLVSVSILFAFAFKIAQCYTPGGIQGQCVSLYSCSNVLERFQGQLSGVITSYLRSLQCESNIGRYPHVCCVMPNPSQAQQPASTDELPFNQVGSRAGNVLASVCPIAPSEHIVGDRIVGGIDAELNEYPWTVILEYRNR